MNSEVNNSYEEEVYSAKIAYEEAVFQTKKAKKDLMEYIETYAGREVREKIEAKKIWIGMEIELLVASWGKAGEVKETYAKGKKIQKCYYFSYVNRLGNVKYKAEVTLENEIVAGWKDLT